MKRIVERLFLCNLRFAVRDFHPIHQGVPQRGEAIELFPRDRFCRREYEFRRIKRFAVARYSEIQMRSGRESTGAHVAHDLSLIHPSADFHGNF